MTKQTQDTTEQGSWVSWGDFLGTAGNGGIWTKKTLLKFLTDCRDQIIMLEGSELLILLANAGLEYQLTENKRFKAITRNEIGSDERTDAVDEMINDIEAEVNSGIDDSDVEAILGTEADVTDEIDIDEADVTDQIDIDEKTGIRLTPEAIIESFKIYDHEYIRLENLDQEKVKFLIQNRINKLWNDVLNNRISIEEVKAGRGGKYFTQIQDEFLVEYEFVMSIENPKGYCFQYPPMPMQKLVSYRLKKNRSYGNWSTVGAGKTLAGVYAGRYVGAKNTVIVTYNSTVIGWKKSLNSYFNPDSMNIYSKTDMDTVVFDKKKHNYLILNYEFFQQGQRNENRLYEFMQRNDVDYVILDEVHSVKQRKEDNSLTVDQQLEQGMLSNRRQLVMKSINEIKVHNPDMYFMIMTATPIINNLVEAKKLLEMLQGEKFNELSTMQRSVKAGLEFHKHIVLNGIRYEHTPKNKKDEIVKLSNGDKPLELEVNGDDLLEALDGETNDLHIEQIVLEHKLECVKDHIESGTMIFTYYVKGIADRIKDYCEELGLKAELYTGSQNTARREEVKKLFQNKEIDVVIGSLPIGTGVDGFQDVCDRLICIGLPWTHSEFEQLVGRIKREGSAFKTIDVIIPKVIVNYYDENEGEDKTWSRDRHKLNIIKSKKDLFGIVVNGIIPDGIVSDLGSVKQKSIKSLNNIIKKIKSGEFTLGQKREEIDKELLEYEELDGSKPFNSELSEFNRKGRHQRSTTTHKEFTDDPKSFFRYHKLRAEAIKDWSEIPYEYIAKMIRNKNHVIADFGCGENKFKDCIPNNVHSFDHVAFDDSVIACDMKNTPLEDESIDGAVLSLSLWGSNSEDYIKEAYRVLNFSGLIYIAEPSKSYETPEDIEKLKELLTSNGFDIVGGVENRGKFVYVKGYKK